MDVGNKFLLSTQKYSVPQIVIFSYLSSALIFFFYLLWLWYQGKIKQNTMYKFEELFKLKNFPDFFVFLVLGILTFLSLVIFRTAQAAAPNFVYVKTIASINILFSMALTSYLFGDHLNIGTAVGGTFMVIGLMLVIYYSSKKG